MSVRLPTRLLAVALAAAAGGALAAEAWSPATAPNGAFAVSTPCSAAELAAAQSVPANALNNIPIEPGARVLCRKGKLLFMAGTVAAPPSARSLFDILAVETRADPTAEGVPTVSTRDGRRVFVNFQQKQDAMAQTGFVEVDRNTIVLVLAGVDAGSDLRAADQRGVIDRFFASVKVMGR